MDTAAARDLLAEAERANERRVVVLAGDRGAGLAAADRLLDALPIALTETSLVSTSDDLACEHVPVRNAGRLLGTTRNAVVVDCHDDCRPNALGRVAGAVDGGGLLVLVTPDLDDWPTRRDAFDEGLAVPPFDTGDVTGRFRRRFVDTLRAHPGIAIYDVDSDTVERDGHTNPAPRIREPLSAPPESAAFPREAYGACLTADQMDALATFESLREPGHAVVADADRGRGKSSAAGLAAACLARDGLDVLVTAPGRRSAAELFVRARELLGDLDGLASDGDTVETTTGGRIRFAKPPEAADLPGDPDAVFADEAAAIPVRLLESLLDCPRLAFTTTVHGYEGAGRGFDVRFRDRLAETDHDVHEASLSDPIRYAGGDPVEAWAFRALLLDARPAVDPLVEDAAPETVEYASLSGDDLAGDDHLLREVFGLLVYAHYRTEPNDLARLLDAPNLGVRALLADGHVVSVALLAREGGLGAELRAAMYDGERVKGNMIPDVLTSQLRDEDAAVPFGYRVMRIATHHAVRSGGLGSMLLSEVESEFRDDDGRDADLRGEAVDYLGVGYGATADLLDFWAENGYRTVHLSTTRNDASGEFSAVMLRPASEAGDRLTRRHGRRFSDRVAGVLCDAGRDVDADVVRGVLRSVDATGSPDLDAYEWRVVADAAYGPGLSDVAPDPFTRLTVAALVDGLLGLDARAERLLVRRTLQRRRWPAVADELGFHSTGECMRAFGRACRPLVDAYGDETAMKERERFGGGE